MVELSSLGLITNINGNFRERRLMGGNQSWQRMRSAHLGIQAQPAF